MKKWILVALSVLMVFGCVGCNREPINPNGGGMAEGFSYPQDYVEEWGTPVAEKTEQGIRIANETGKGGYTVMWNRAFSFKQFSMKFIPEIEKVENARAWIGFAFNDSADTWYDSSNSILVLFRPDADADGNPTGTATFNIVATLMGFQKTETVATEVKNVPIYMDKENTFEMKYLDEVEGIKIEDWTLSVNGVDIVVKPSGDSTGNSTADFSKVDSAMTDSTMYLQFASQRKPEDGKTSFTVTEVNGEKLN